ncbi:STAS domain-containing protein [bacterium]|nr:STAS domain-containing protein [bacterium]
MSETSGVEDTTRTGGHVANLTILPVEQPQTAKGGTSVLVYKVAGEIDLDTVGILRDHLESVERRGQANLVLDLQDTKYINSSALAVLVKFSETFRERGGGIALARVGSRVKLVFEMLGLLVFFRFYDSVDKAKESFTKRPAK